MANPLSTVRGTSKQALYPFTRTPEFITRVNIAANGCEQRFVVRGLRYNFALAYRDLLKADGTSQQSWFTSAKGKFDRTITITLDGVTYSYLTSEADAFDLAIRQQGLYETRIQLKQTQNPSWSPAAAPSAYPTLANGLRAQYPYTRTTRYATWVNDVEAGERYSLSSYGGPFSNFPSAGLLSWKLEYPVINETDLATLETFFLACQGRYRGFSFTDPDTGTVYSHCRLNQDAMPIEYTMARRGGHQVSTSLSVTQFFV